MTDTPDFRIADRSTLQNYAECPAMARFIESGAVLNTSVPMVSGDLAHGCLSMATHEYVTSGGHVGLTDLIELVMQAAAMSRPDVQPDVIKALPRSSVYPWAKFIQTMHPSNILRYDGGEGARSGQLAWDIPDLKVRVTSEVDLLHAGPSPEVLHEIDYKTGNAKWNSTEVAKAFQFAMHGWLILHNYPDVLAVSVRIWNTRTGGPTYSVFFERKDIFQLDCRVRAAAEQYAAWCDNQPQDCPTWPKIDSCERCPAASLCPACGPLIHDAASDPADIVDSLVAREANVAAMRKLASAIVTATGEDIFTPAGNAFGTGKPKANRKPTMSLYSKGTPDADDGNQTAATEE